MQEAGPKARLLASFIEDFLNDEGISQAELASRLGIHQSSVSRALHQVAKRRGSAYVRLVGFMQQGGTGRGVDRFQRAFRSVWDGTEEHADALARIIAACQGLTPGRPGGRDSDA